MCISYSRHCTFTTNCKLAPGIICLEYAQAFLPTLEKPTTSTRSRLSYRGPRTRFKKLTQNQSPVLPATFIPTSGVPTRSRLCCCYHFAHAFSWNQKMIHKQADYSQSHSFSPSANLPSQGSKDSIWRHWHAAPLPAPSQHCVSLAPSRLQQWALPLAGPLWKPGLLVLSASGLSALDLWLLPRLKLWSCLEHLTVGWLTLKRPACDETVQFIRNYKHCYSAASYGCGIF